MGIYAGMLYNQNICVMIANKTSWCIVIWKIILLVCDFIRNIPAIFLDCSPPY